jgi:hypothetical protein
LAELLCHPTWTSGPSAYQFFFSCFCWAALAFFPTLGQEWHR